MAKNASCPIDHIEITDLSGNRVLDDGSLGGGSPCPKKAAGVIKILAVGAGTMAVIYDNGVARTYSDLTLGEECLGNFKQISASGTGVTKVRVSWLEG